MSIPSFHSQETSKVNHSEERVLNHPLDTYRTSMDYLRFESEVIRPYLREVRIRRADYAASELPLTISPGRSSLVDLLRFMEETDYNSHSTHFHPSGTSSPVTSMVIAPPPIPFLPLVGYISKKRPDCFIWESRFFEKGSLVVLGRSGRLGVVTGICGIGRNYIMRGIRESGRLLDGEVRIQTMAISALPSSNGFLLVHRLLLCLFPLLLGSMRDYQDDERVVDMVEKGDGVVDISAGSLGMITSSSEIVAADSGEYFKAEEL